VSIIAYIAKTCQERDFNRQDIGALDSKIFISRIRNNYDKADNYQKEKTKRLLAEVFFLAFNASLEAFFN